MSYADFIASKRREHGPVGFDAVGVHPSLFDHQRCIVEWACRMGRCAIFADTGLGKTRMQLEWARQVKRYTGGEVLLLAPLAVGDQTIAEAASMGIDPPTVLNYERLHQVDPSQFVGVVLDESSILKAVDGKTRLRLTEAFADTPYRLACTATPAPNDHTELGNHAAFLGVCTREEMLAEYFVHDGGSTQSWRLKGHARRDFWRWVSSWAVMVRKPSDLGYDDGAYDLPELNLHTLTVQHEAPREDGMLFAMSARTLADQRKVRRDSIEARCEAAARLVAAEPDEQWLIWCELNDESAELTECVIGAVEVAGTTPEDERKGAMLGFAAGDVRVLVTKPKIAGFGMNWQSCARMIFVSPTHSYEQWYQAVRRCWRFGQARPVHVWMMQTSADGAVTRNLQRKARRADEMAAEMAAMVRDHQMMALRGARPGSIDDHNMRMEVPSWIASTK